MINLSETAPKLCEEIFSANLDYSKDPAIKRLLDVVVSILSEEYIRIAKENPDIFSI